MELEILDGIPCRPYTGDIPSEVPKSWIIFNAPRPIHGHVQWQGDFLSGVFYAAVDPESVSRGWMIQDNQALDAIIAIPCDYEDMERVVLARMNPRYLPLWRDADKRLREQHVLAKVADVFRECSYKEIQGILNQQ